MENGKCAVAEGLTNGIAFGSTEFHVIRCTEKVNNRFLFGFLNRETIRKRAESVMTGSSGHRRVPISFYQELRLHLPEIPEQEKIANALVVYNLKIDEAKERLLLLEGEYLKILQSSL